MIEFDRQLYEVFVGSWLDGIDQELMFWNDFLVRSGGDWPEVHARRVDPAPSCQLERHAEEFGVWPIRALDVGAGPISNVGIATARGPIELHACDALAELYAPLLAANGVRPYVHTVFALAERLTDVYAENSFDVVTIENALDHAFDPFIGIGEMLRVCRTGGHVLLYHAEDEAERECYSGFHQWNVSERGGRLLIWRGEHEHEVGEVFAGLADVEAWRERVGDLWMIRARMRKVAHPPRRPQSLTWTYDAFVLAVCRKRGAALKAAGASVVTAPGVNGASVLELENTMLRAQVDDLHRRIAALESSASWRVTSPLRRMDRWWKGR